MRSTTSLIPLVCALVAACSQEPALTRTEYDARLKAAFADCAWWGETGRQLAELRIQGKPLSDGIALVQASEPLKLQARAAAAGLLSEEEKRSSAAMAKNLAEQAYYVHAVLTPSQTASLLYQECSGAKPFAAVTPESTAARHINEGRQLHDAVSLAEADGFVTSGKPLTALGDLVTQSYLAQIPEGWTLGTGNYAGAAVLTVEVEVCAAVNKKGGADSVGGGLYGCVPGDKTVFYKL